MARGSLDPPPPRRELTTLHLGGVGSFHGQAATLNPLKKTREKLAVGEVLYTPPRFAVGRFLRHVSFSATSSRGR